MIGDPLIEASGEPFASCDAAFSCLLQLGGQSGGNEVAAVDCRRVVNGETLSISRLIELAGDLGIKTTHARLDWQRLQAPGFGYPALALLKNTNVIVLTGGGRGGASEVAVWDPLNPYEEILYVSREDFERVWTGHALIVTTQAANRAAMSPSSDFCWFTSAGLELLRKAPAKGQNSKVLAHTRKEASTRSNAPRGRTRQTDRAIVSATRGEFAVAHVETADGQLPPDPGEGAQPSTPVWSRSAPERRLSPLVRFCMAAGLLTAASSGVFLLSNSATGPVAAAIILAKEVWAVAPNSAHSTGQAMQNATTRSIEKVPPTGSAPIPAPLPATPAAEDAVATPTAPAVQPDAARPSAEPAAPSAEHAVAAPAALPIQFDAATPSAAPGLATPATLADTKADDPPRSTSSSGLSADEVAELLARGDTLLSIGDVASARLFYERAADAGGGVAAIRLGETFDPLFLDRVHLSGVRGDPGAASFWYHRARDLGATDAQVLLKALEAK